MVPRIPLLELKNPAGVNVGHIADDREKAIEEANLSAADQNQKQRNFLNGLHDLELCF